MNDAELEDTIEELHYKGRHGFMFVGTGSRLMSAVIADSLSRSSGFPSNRRDVNSSLSASNDDTRLIYRKINGVILPEYKSGGKALHFWGMPVLPAMEELAKVVAPSRRLHEFENTVEERHSGFAAVIDTPQEDMFFLVKHFQWSTHAWAREQGLDDEVILQRAEAATRSFVNVRRTSSGWEITHIPELET